MKRNRQNLIPSYFDRIDPIRPEYNPTPRQAIAVPMPSTILQRLQRLGAMLMFRRDHGRMR